MKRIRNWSIAGTVFTLIAGTLLHFIHDWFGGSLTAVIGAVNESTWEHLKLIFWPMVLFGILEFFVYGKKQRAFLPAKVQSILLGMTIIVVLFYTYTGILGYHIAAVDISTFVIGTIAAYVSFYRAMRAPAAYLQTKAAAITASAALLLLLLFFFLFTANPPHIGLFLDPVSGTYGLRTA